MLPARLMHAIAANAPNYPNDRKYTEKYQVDDILLIGQVPIMLEQLKIFQEKRLQKPQTRYSERLHISSVIQATAGQVLTFKRVMSSN